MPSFQAGIDLVDMRIKVQKALGPDIDTDSLPENQLRSTDMVLVLLVMKVSTSTYSWLDYPFLPHSTMF